jgi:hypothetical protein
MGKRSRENDDEIRKYFPPDLATIIRHADPSAHEKARREAMEDPELQAAVAQVREFRKREAQQADAETFADTKPSAPEAPKGGVSASSPWAERGDGVVIDKAALPSSSGPKPEALAPKQFDRAASAISESSAQPRRAARPRWLFLAVVAIAASPVAMWAVMSSYKTVGATTGSTALPKPSERSFLGSGTTPPTGSTPTDSDVFSAGPTASVALPPPVATEVLAAENGAAPLPTLGSRRSPETMAPVGPRMSRPDSPTKSPSLRESSPHVAPPSSGEVSDPPLPPSSPTEPLLNK